MSDLITTVVQNNNVISTTISDDNSVNSDIVPSGFIASSINNDNNVDSNVISLGITPAIIGLGNVDNTSDANKPVSIATQAALNTKQPVGNYSTGGGTATGTNTGDQDLSGYALTSSLSTVTVDATIINGSTNAVSGNAVYDALALKAPLISPSFTTPTLGVATATTINNLAITAAANSTLTIEEDKGITLFDSITTDFGGYINTSGGGYIVTGVNGHIYTNGMGYIHTGLGGHIQTGDGGFISTTAGGSFATGTGNLTGPNASGTVPVYTGTPASGQVLTASGTAGLTNWTSATSAATANTLVRRDSDGGVSFAGGSGTGLNVNSYSGQGAYISSQTFIGAEIFSNSHTGAFISSTSGIGAEINSSSGTYHVTFGFSGINQSFIARVKGAFGWFRGAFTGRIHPPDTLTADRTYTLPDDTGTVALIDPSSGTQTFSGAQTFTNSAIETGTGVAISGTATSGTILAVSGTASTGGSLFKVTQGSTSFRITETGALLYNGTVQLNRGGGAIISLGGLNNSNIIGSGNTGSHTATDFVLRGGTADRTAGNLFQVQNFTQPVLTVSALTGTGNVGIGTTTPAEKLSVVGNATVSGSLTVSGSTQFASTTRPTSSGTGTPASNSLLTRADVDESFLDFDTIALRDDFIGGQDGQLVLGQLDWERSQTNGTGSWRTMTPITGFGVGALFTAAAFKGAQSLQFDVSNVIGGGGFPLSLLTNSSTRIKFRVQFSSLNARIDIGFRSYVPASSQGFESRKLALNYTPVAATWTPSTAIIIREFRSPTVANGRKYYASVGGTTGTTEPTWPLTAGGTVTDGTVTWAEHGFEGGPNLKLVQHTVAGETAGVVVDTGIAAAINTWYVVEGIWVSGSTWRFTINGASTDITTIGVLNGAMTPYFRIENTDNVANSLSIDYFGLFSRITRS